METFGDLFPVNHLQDWGKQNITMMQRAMSMFAPFPGAAGAPENQDSAEPGPGPGRAPDPATATHDTGQTKSSAQQIADLKNQIEVMQEQIAALLEQKDAADKGP